MPDGFICPVTCQADRAPTGAMRCKDAVGDAVGRRECVFLTPGSATFKFFHMEHQKDLEKKNAIANKEIVI